MIANKVAGFGEYEPRRDFPKAAAYPSRSTLMQIAGSLCRMCGKPIVLATDGKFCRSCGKFAHLDCERSVSCAACGNLLDYYQPPKRDVLAEAFDPREKRSFNSIGPMLTALLALLLFLLWFYLGTLT